MASWKTWKAGKHEVDDASAGEFSVRLRNYSDRQYYWMNFWISDGDLLSDWNDYIFCLNNSNDMHRKAVQENADNFEYAFEAGEHYLVRKGLLHQDEKGFWKVGPEPKESIVLPKKKKS